MSARQRRANVAIALGVLWALMLAVCIAPIALAQSAGELSVKVVNKTPGGESTGNLPLSIFVVQGSGQQITAQGQTDANGSFAANDIAGPVGASYIISTTYKGVPYHTAPISLPATDVQLIVYETTDDDSKIKVAQAGVVIVEVDPELQRLRFLETVTLLNSGDRTFLPSTTGGSLLRFDLPDGAGNLVVGGGLTDSEVTQADKGFATDMPAPPGETNVSYAYEMAYGALAEGGYALVRRNIAYPIDSLQVLAMQGGFRLESPLLTDDGVVTVGTHSYRQFSAKDLPAHSEVSFELRDLPLIQPVLRPSNPWLQGVVVLLSLLALLAPILLGADISGSGGFSLRWLMLRFARQTQRPQRPQRQQRGLLALAPPLCAG